MLHVKTITSEIVERLACNIIESTQPRALRLNRTWHSADRESGGGAVRHKLVDFEELEMERLASIGDLIDVIVGKLRWSEQ